MLTCSDFLDRHYHCAFLVLIQWDQSLMLASSIALHFPVNRPRFLPSFFLYADVSVVLTAFFLSLAVQKHSYFSGSWSSCDGSRDIMNVLFWFHIPNARFFIIDYYPPSVFIYHRKNFFSLHSILTSDSDLYVPPSTFHLINATPIQQSLLEVALALSWN